MKTLQSHFTGSFALATALLFFVTTCDNGASNPVASEELTGASHRSASPSVVKVMTRNIYHGASLEPLFAPDLPAVQVPVVAAQIWSGVLATDFTDRAEALADEIEAVEPDLVGLQEVARYRMQIPGDAASGGMTPATTDVLNFLDILLGALDDHDLAYDVAVLNQNIDAEVPMLAPGSPTGLADIRLTDYDVILVRNDVAWTNPQSANYAVALPVEIGGVTMFVPRGWTSVDVMMSGKEMLFVNTHLEAFFPPVQVAQAQELLLMLALESRPTLLVGDFNSESDGSTTPTYGMVIGAGFTDIWEPRGRGFTCCHAPDLRNAVADLDERIDFVFLRGDFGFDPPGKGDPFQGSLVGYKPSDRSPTGLWPSDHVGVVATLRFLRGPE